MKGEALMADKTHQASDPALGTYASFDSRICARIIDGAVLAAVASVWWGLCYVAALWGPLPPVLLVVLTYLGLPVYVAYYAVMTARSGQTFGKRYMGIQVQTAEGLPPGPGVSLWRALVETICAYLIRFLVGLVDYLWYYCRRDRRTLHDLAAGTSVRVVGPYPSAAVMVVLLSLLVTMLAKVSLFVTVTCPQTLENMSPVIAKGDYYQISRLAYRQRSLSLGDVVQFKAPLGFTAGFPVGRVVGVAGDYLTLRNGVVERATVHTAGQLAPNEVLVPVGSVAVLGDNRATPEAGGYPRRSFPPSLPAPPSPAPPPLLVPPAVYPPSSGKPVPVPPPPPPPMPRSSASSSPIVVVPLSDIEGQVIAVTRPLWRLHLVR